MENNSGLFKELYIEATITKFTYWLRNHIKGLIHSLSWQAVGGSRPEIIITNPNIKTSSSMDQAWFDIDLAWGKDESGKRNEEGKIIITVKQTGQLLFLRADYSNIVLEDFVSNILVDVLNIFPLSTLQDSNDQVMANDEFGTLSPDEREILSYWKKGHTAKDIGEMVHQKPGTINNRICQLRKLLGEEKVPYHHH